MRNKLINWVIIIIGSILIISLSRSVLDLASRGSIVDEAAERLREKEEVNARLRERYRKVRGESYIERVAREELGMSKEGEVVVVLPADKTQSTMPHRQVAEEATKLKTQTGEEETSAEKPFWKKWWENISLD